MSDDDLEIEELKRELLSIHQALANIAKRGDIVEPAAMESLWDILEARKQRLRELQMKRAQRS